MGSRGDYDRVLLQVINRDNRQRAGIEVRPGDARISRTKNSNIGARVVGGRRTLRIEDDRVGWYVRKAGYKSAYVGPRGARVDRAENVHAAAAEATDAY